MLLLSPAGGGQLLRNYADQNIFYQSQSAHSGHRTVHPPLTTQTLCRSASSPHVRTDQKLIDRLTDSWLANQLAYFHFLSESKQKPCVREALNLNNCTVGGPFIQAYHLQPIPSTCICFTCVNMARGNFISSYLTTRSKNSIIKYNP